MSVCRNFAANPLPAPIDEMKPTWAELSVISVTALAQAACRYEVNGRERKKALSRSLVFKSEPPAATCLPRPLQDSEHFTVFAKVTGDEAALFKKKRLLVRRKATGALGSLFDADFCPKFYLLKNWQ